MFGAVNTLLIFLYLRTINGELQFPDSEYAKYGRNPPYNLHNLRERDGQDENMPIPLLNLQGGDNVQKLVLNQNYDKEVAIASDEKNLGPDGPPFSGKPKKGKNKGNAASPNVYRVQEMTGQRWPMGVVPFFVDKNIYDPTTVKRIVKAMSVIESVSCVMFRELKKKPKRSPDGWLHFTNPNQERDCVHTFSAVDGGIEIVLGFDCLYPDEILHSLLHALGFRDEVTHPHRDQYIRVLWNNIKPKYWGLFLIRDEVASYKLVEYDPMSIMHFHDRAFSDNGAPTITALVPGLQIAASTSLSQLDIMRLKLAFSHECNKRNVGDLLNTCKNSLSPHKSIAPDEGKEDVQIELVEPNTVEVEAGETLQGEMKAEDAQNANYEEQSQNKVGTPQKETENEQVAPDKGEENVQIEFVEPNTVEVDAGETLQGEMKAEDTQNANYEEQSQNNVGTLQKETENEQVIEGDQEKQQDEEENEQMTDEVEKKNPSPVELNKGNEKDLEETVDEVDERVPIKFRSYRGPRG